MDDDQQNPDALPEEDQEPKPDPNEEMYKFRDLLKTGLSNIAPTGDNLSFAYTTLNLAEKEILNLFGLLRGYPNLRYVNLSNNKLTSLESITELPHLISLNVSKNELTDISIFSDESKLPHLQHLNMSGNKLTKLAPLGLKRLRKLFLNENEITTCRHLKGHDNLEFLELQKNKLKNLKGIMNMSNLRQLNVSENEIEDFRHLINLPKLQRLNLNTNNIDKIQAPLPFLPLIEHIDIGGNKLPDLKEIQKLEKISVLKSLNAVGNPATDEFGDASKKELIMLLPKLQRINEDDVTADDRREALEELQERKNQEDEKKRQEEEERLAAEEEERRVAEEARLAAEEEARAAQEEERRLLEEAERAKKEAQGAEAGQPKEEGGDADEGS